MIGGVEGGYWTLWTLPPVIVIVDPSKRERERESVAAFAKEF